MAEYKKNYNEGRKAHSMPLEISRQLELIKDTKKFKSIGETVQYLLDIERDLQKSNMIVDRYKCKECDKDVNVTDEMALDLHKFKHRNCKSGDPDCNGTLRHTYGLAFHITGATTTKDGANELTDKAEDLETKYRRLEEDKKKFDLQRKLDILDDR